MSKEKTIFKQYPLSYNPILRYFEKMESGEEVVSSKIYKVYEKLVHDINNPNEWIYSPEHALHPIEFIETFCKHSKGKWSGESVKLELWQKAGIAAVFGFIHKTKRIRKYQEVLWVVGRKNGKSTIASGIALYLLCADSEGGPEIYTVATKKQQAKIVWDEAKRMIKKSPMLKATCTLRHNEILVPTSEGKMEPLGRDSDTLDGLNVHGAIMDEIHAWKTMEMYDVISDGTSARENPLTFCITTAGTVRESVYDIKYEESVNIINGFYDANAYKNERMLPLIYELDKREEWTEPSAWKKANPGLGTIKSIDYLKNKVNAAREEPLRVSNLLTKEFNVRSNSNEAWLTFEALDNSVRFDLDNLKPDYAIGGSDLSSSVDLTAACIAFMLPGDDSVYYEHMYWIPEDLVEQKVKEDKIPYDKWIELGYVRTTPGNKVHYKYVTDWFRELMYEHNVYIPYHGYDAWSAEYYVEEMRELTGKNSMIKVYQGKRTLSDPMQRLGADLKKKKIIYNNNPVTKWCLSNTVVDIDKNGNIQPAKTKVRRRIDGMACMLDAYVVLQDNINDYKALIGD